MNEISRSFSAFGRFFFSQKPSTDVDAFLFVRRTELVKSLSAALKCVPIIYPKPHSISFENHQLLFDYEYLYLLITFSAFPSLLELKYWSCLHFRFLCCLSLIPFCFFCFYSTLFTSSVIKRDFCVFRN